MHPGISDLMKVPKLSNFPSLEFPLSILADYCIVFGQFGVGVFFIVSGLVIPFSLRSDTKLGFLYRRAIRIYPVYIAGFCVVMLSLYLLSYYTERPFMFSIGDMLAHFGVITRAPLGVDRIDGISWTLEVEIYFYLVMCVFGTKVLNFDIKKYIATAFAIAAASTVTFKTQGYLMGVQVAAGLLLLLGTAYYSLLNKKIDIKEFWGLQVTVLALILALWLGVAEPATYIAQWIIGYILAIVVFYICFLLRNSIKENKVLSHFSDISYPLYVVHALFGYAIMYVLVDHGFGPYASIATATGCAYLASLLIHVFIEKPSMTWIKLSRTRSRVVQST
jgi:peptidoglycan/LPS O-acetylase OafA/YrhL